MGILIFPWQMLYMAHPTGHDHHHHDEPSACEMREIYKGESSFLPPMHCNSVSIEADDYNQA